MGKTNGCTFNGNFLRGLKGEERLKAMYEFKYKQIGEENKDLVWLQSYENFYNAVTRLPNYHENCGLQKRIAKYGYRINNMECTTIAPREFVRRVKNVTPPKPKPVSKVLTPYDYLLMHIRNYGNTFINKKQFNALGKIEGLNKIANENNWKFNYRRVPNGYIIQS